MTTDTYVIYDQEPVKIFLDLPAIFIGLIPPVLILNILLHFDIMNQVIGLSISFLMLISILTATSLCSKYLTSNKIKIETKDGSLTISYPNKPLKEKKVIYFKDIIKTENTDQLIGRFITFKIYTKDGRIIAFTKFALYNLIVRDDLSRFKNDLNDRLKHNKG
jgi:hypothetical protein